MGKKEGHKAGLFSEETLEVAGAQEWEWQRSIENDEAAELELATYSGIKLKPLYSPRDIAEMSYDDIPLPGQYPYTRGFNPLGYRAEPWRLSQSFAAGTGADARKRWEFIRSLGVAGRLGRDEAEELANLRIFADLPTQRGYDPDEPESRGRVGGCGISLSTMEDMAAIFEGVPLDKAYVTFIAHSSSLAAVALYIAYAETRGYSPDRLLLRAHNDLYQGGLHHDVISFPPKSAIRLMTEFIYYSVKYMPRAQHTTILAYPFGESGANAIQQVAVLLSVAITLTEECIKVGLDPDDVVPGFYNHEWVGMDLFEEVAKLRAKRRLWAKIFKERFGCKNLEALRYKCIPQTGGVMAVAQEPLNNIIRNTVMTLAGVLAGVDGIFTTGYDEPLCVPTELGAQLAIRTQQILYHETSLPHVIDPLGGSYYVEWLTNKIEEDVNKYLDEMERMGGFLKCWETGWIRGELEKNTNERQRKIDRGEIVIVGQNKYRLPEEQQPEVPIFPSFEPRVEEELNAQVRRYRERRDQQRARAALAQVQQAAEAIMQDWPRSCGVLMPAIINAFRNQATLGEIQRILQQVCGYIYWC